MSFPLKSWVHTTSHTDPFHATSGENSSWARCEMRNAAPFDEPSAAMTAPQMWMTPPSRRFQTTRVFVPFEADAEPPLARSWSIVWPPV